MSRLGRVVHYKSQELVVRAESAPKLGKKVHDKQNKIVGEVSDIFGPVKNPYVAVKITKGAEAGRSSFEGLEVYLKGGKARGEK